MGDRKGEPEPSSALSCADVPGGRARRRDTIVAPTPARGNSRTRGSFAGSF